MGNENQENFNAEPQAQFIKEDWGGDGSRRLNLSGRSTAISPDYVPRQYQLFNSNTATKSSEWRIQGMPENVSQRLLSWHESGALTSKVFLPPGFEAPAGIFTADLEIFILSGNIQLGEWKLRPHGYSFIPAGVKVGSWKVLGNQGVEILWMANGPVPLKYQEAEHDLPNARIHEFIPALDSQILPWGRTETTQFEVSKKKYLRKYNNGGGTWLITVLPHYDSIHPMIQSYNEEDYCLSGYLDLGGYQFVKDHFSYCPSFSTLPRHKTVDGGLFFVRVDRDLSQGGTVLSYPYEH